MITIIDKLDANPKSATLLRQWFTERMIESIEDMENFQEETLEIMKQHLVSNEAVSNIIQDNVRSLFDFFDEQEIYITITRNYLASAFEWDIQTDVQSPPIAKFSSRKEAEMSAINEAFKILEAILCETK
jgi:uncharacterized coiled-coil protein SlyX